MNKKEFESNHLKSKNKKTTNENFNNEVNKSNDISLTSNHEKKPNFHNHNSRKKSFKTPQINSKHPNNPNKKNLFKPEEKKEVSSQPKLGTSKRFVQVLKPQLKAKSPNLFTKNADHNQTFERDFLGKNNLVETSRIPRMKVGGLEYLNNQRSERQKHIFKEPNKIPTKIFALGGIEEIGKNMYCIEHDDEIIIVDCGIKFANKKELPGISGIIPSFSYLKENEAKVKALVITHGHEDHIGGVPYLLKKINIPVVYAPVIALELIKRKVSEHKKAVLNKAEVFSDLSVFQTKHFTIDFYRVNHSIPDSFGVAITTPNGNIASSGDFRFDFGNNADKTDISKISKIALRNIDVLLCESTNAENEGFNESEDNVLLELNNLISSCSGRIIITSFASNLGRVEEIIRIAIKRNRKLVIVGRSMVGNVTVSRKIGYLRFDDKFMIQARDIDQYPDKEIMIICTGSQGEDTAALNTIAKGRHAWISLKPTDTVILSSNAIPGNFVSVDELMNRLSKSGCRLYYNSANLKIHSSGHGAKMEQQLLISLMNPKYLVPIHGEYKMLRALQKSASELGIPKENVFIISNGQVLYLLNGVVSHSNNEAVDASEVYIDGNDATLEGNKIIKDRFELSENGVIYCQVYVDLKKRKVLSISPLATAGSFYAFDSMDLFKRIVYHIHTDLKTYFDDPTKKVQLKDLKRIVESKVSALIWRAKNKKTVIAINIETIDEDKLFDKPIQLKKAQTKNLSSETPPEQIQ
ncbi:ribonuclease J [Mycoplasmoides fastidiosum]|uniref:Ribonuclease J n=1 Tax=Mycoplasmoides fastidiosum TaxID=92758 RepID=A0ABU0LYP3_9BACT|nr:ribonuclease J [Mycoplasmoides fastidiosum]